MRFLQIPYEVLITDLTHAERTILLWLSNHHFQFCQRDFEKEFFITDRDLSNISSCSTRTVYKAKRKLSALGIVEFRIGPKNKTHYKLNEEFWSTQ